MSNYVISWNDKGKTVRTVVYEHSVEGARKRFVETFPEREDKMIAIGADTLKEYKPKWKYGRSKSRTYDIKYSLSRFWQEFNILSNRREKIDLLYKFANRECNDASKKTLYDKRKEYNSIKKPAQGKCKACGINDGENIHHIILLKNGGIDTPWNQIILCYSCHKLIHPWLRTKN